MRHMLQNWVLQWTDNTDTSLRANIEDMEDVHDRTSAESKLRKFLVGLLVWNDEELKLSDNSPPLMLGIWFRE